ncbi:MAG: DUF881 domain-containing protein [Clostridia bacterium]|nr:DUF881 domain-containing protein [Clostridia bacterium]
MKGKNIMIFTIGIMCFLLMYVTFIQLKTVEVTDVTAIKNMRETELRTALSNWKTKYEEVNKKVEETTIKTNEYKEKVNNNQEASELLQKELSQLNMLIGKTDVIGQGIVVTLTDGEGESYKTISAYDLIHLINELKLAGAEAISINDERIMNMTDIADVSNTFIVISGQRVVSPYIVKVIGNQAYLESALITKNGFVDTLKASEKEVTIEKSNNVKINAYKGEIELKYVTSK